MPDTRIFEIKLCSYALIRSLIMAWFEWEFWQNVLILDENLTSRQSLRGELFCAFRSRSSRQERRAQLYPFRTWAKQLSLCPAMGPHGVRDSRSPPTETRAELTTCDSCSIPRTTTLADCHSRVWRSPVLVAVQTWVLWVALLDETPSRQLRRQRQSRHRCRSRAPSREAPPKASSRARPPMAFTATSSQKQTPHRAISTD